MSENRYTTSWEGFWGTLTGAPDEIFWDAEPTDASQRDLALFQPFFDPKLPLIDVGCGNGKQTRFLATHYASVIGTEIVPSALAVAQTQNPASNITYRMLDLLHPGQPLSLHEEIGDANVYVRTVLHQLSPADQLIASQSLGHLLGSRGTLYLIELSSAAEPFFEHLIQQFGAPPPGLARVFQHNITPGMLHEADISRLFPPNHFVLLETGENSICTTHTLPTGEMVKVPAFYAILRHQAAGEAA